MLPSDPLHFASLPWLLLYSAAVVVVVVFCYGFCDCSCIFSVVVVFCCNCGTLLWLLVVPVLIAVRCGCRVYHCSYYILRGLLMSLLDTDADVTIAVNTCS